MTGRAEAASLPTPLDCRAHLCVVRLVSAVSGEMGPADEYIPRVLSSRLCHANLTIGFEMSSSQRAAVEQSSRLAVVGSAGLPATVG